MYVCMYVCATLETPLISPSKIFSLHAQSNLDRTHPSIPLDFKLLELWRIHPMWNIDGCLTFSFLNETLSWEHCDVHFKRLARI